MTTLYIFIFRMLILEIYAFELQIENNFEVYYPRSFKSYLSSGEKGLRNSGLNGTRTLNSAMPVKSSTS